MKEKIKNAFDALGFELEELGDFGCKFQYEDSCYLWLYSGNDDKFLNIALPGVLDKGNIDEMLFYKLMDYLNGILKYIKVSIVYDSMWYFCGRELIGDEDIELVIRRMISHLFNAKEMQDECVMKFMSEDDSEDAQNEDVVNLNDTEIVNYGINEGKNKTKQV